jgi:hypothetical protein
MTAKKSFLLRVNPQLYEVYEAWAADELRSVNAHIEFVLRDAAVRAGRWPKGKVLKGSNPEEEDSASLDKKID